MRIVNISDIHSSAIMPLGHTIGKGDMLTADLRVNLTAKESNDLMDAMERSRDTMKPMEIEVKFK